jgi:cation diffusion facilitator family transporter
MQEHKLEAWKHSHSFGQDQKRQGEARTLIVIAITSSMMVVEIAAGLAFGSMALLADGLHMGSHAVALGINAFAYVYARKHAQNAKYSFGTGKVNTLGGYTGAILLAVFAALMAWESIIRLFNPVSIAFNQAIFVAVLGLLVNGASVFILGVQHDHAHDHGHEHHHDHHHDHNLMSAYLHVLADALTSLLAIIALLIGKYYGAIWMDPLMGIVGAILVARWSIGLLKSTSSILLDEQGPQATRDKIRQSIEEEGIVQVVDLHVWAVGPGIHSAMISVVAMDPMPPSHYKEKLQQSIQLDHLTVEVHAYPSDD